MLIILIIIQSFLCLAQTNISALVIEKQAKSQLTIDKFNKYYKQLDGINLQSSQTDIKVESLIDNLSKKVQPNQHQVTTIGRLDYRRPIWNLAHMVNSIKELNYRLGKGANAVEADVTFNALGQPIYMYHGPPCDCWRHCHQQEDFDDYLSYVHEISMTEPNGLGRNLTILFLDLKLDYLIPEAKARAGRELADSVVRNLYPINAEYLFNGLSQNNGNNIKPISLILSVNHVTDFDLVNNFIHQLETHNASYLLQRIGFDVGMNDDINLIESMWRRIGKNSINLWQGDGYTNCISPFYNLERLSKAIQKRDSESGYPMKVYQWTIDLHDRIREAFMLGVDAIMTNHPERVLSVLAEPDIYHNFRLASRDDNPFKKVITRYRTGESARYQRSANPVSSGFLGSLIDVINSWLSYMKEIPLLSLPTTTKFWTSKVRRSFKFRLNQYPVDNSIQTRTTARSLNGESFSSKFTATKDPKSSSNISSNVTASTTIASIDTTNNMISSDNATTIPSTTTTTTTVSTYPQIQGKNSNGNSGQLDTNYTSTEPKWYTSFASNFLISLLKLALPVNSTETVDPTTESTVSTSTTTIATTSSNTTSSD